MNPAGKDAEQLLLKAVDQTVDLVNAGSRPTDAVIKVARDMNLPPGKINALVNTFNTGLTTRHRQLSSDTLEKAADFELADPVVVLEELYPSTVKTAAQVAEESVVSFDYAVDPSHMLARRADTLVKAAAARRDWGTSPKPAPTIEFEWSYKQASGRVRRLELDLEEARRVKSAAYDRLSRAFDELQQHFVTAGHVPFGWFAKQAGRLYGEAGATACRHLATTAPLLAKQADDGQLRPSRGPAFEQLDKLLALTDDFIAKNATYQELEASFPTKAAEIMRPFVQPRPSYLTADGELKTAFWSSPFAQNLAGGYTKSILDSISDKASPPSADPANAVLKELTDPQHEATLRNVRLQSLLQDMMTNDDIISGYSGDEVADAFNELNVMSPRLSEQPSVLRSALAKRLQQGRFSDFEIDQLLGSENKLKQRDEVSVGSPLRLTL